ncbi:hypothetical protein MNB_SM-6-169 [hydrothermal vent metagenome]|uniref:Uncharacterized protein n=1 Tax=hydrothermal vent metagenome TaxID=652676 RepID=A0A1W1BT23_9ZZZZ
MATVSSMKKGLKMAEEIIEQIEAFENFQFDRQKNRVVNLKVGEDTDIFKFRKIFSILNRHRIYYTFENNFEIQIIE